jgi:phosphoribosylanthranilate isomerase
MSKIKICGLSRPCDIDAVNEALPDYIGFVFAKSPREVSFIQAAALKQRLNAKIKAVGVFVDAAIEIISALCQDGIIDMVQLHGNEDADYIRQLKKAVVVPIIKAVRVQSAEQIIETQAKDCDYLLLDTWLKGKQGGSGQTFDWSLIPKLNKPYFLAGGLNAANIKEAASYQPYCLDVSSGAETEGKKDGRKIIELVRIVRSEEL